MISFSVDWQLNSFPVALLLKDKEEVLNLRHTEQEKEMLPLVAWLT